MIKGLATWIAAHSAFTVGTTLQVGHREQTSPDRCVVVQETAGGTSNSDRNQTDIEFLQLQFISRGLTYFNARDDIRAIHNLLNGAAGITIGISPIFYLIGVIVAVAPPQYIGQDEERRYEFSVNYCVGYYNVAGI